MITYVVVLTIIINFLSVLTSKNLYPRERHWDSTFLCMYIFTVCTYVHENARVVDQNKCETSLHVAQSNMFTIQVPRNSATVRVMAFSVAVGVEWVNNNLSLLKNPEDKLLLNPRPRSHLGRGKCHHQLLNDTSWPCLCSVQGDSVSIDSLSRTGHTAPEDGFSHQSWPLDPWFWEVGKHPISTLNTLYVLLGFRAVFWRCPTVTWVESNERLGLSIWISYRLWILLNPRE